MGNIETGKEPAVSRQVEDYFKPREIVLVDRKQGEHHGFDGEKEKDERGEGSFGSE